ncbi:Outer membrane protein beta-barrel domain-containing protein [Aquimarina amphilecti]|uniref:Outer membrane protein beta-barrel domain-containing protein n=1 Tax=Aquimarina amphilecti TaxID=1038014 RepID=A0A1H7GBU8_AQUAM|nr:porin family protein [Aquimarina amphilecti]SEK33970.1 Outer membrane protein beta-barrel domain-containing protein [Aquimarina amphilecti]
MIKKILFPVLLVFLISVKTNAQQDRTQLGLKVGYNLSYISGEEIDDFIPRNTIHLGIVGEIPITRFLAIQPELLYSFQGSYVQPGFTDSSDLRFTEWLLKLDYIVLPIMVKYYLTPGFSAEIGPQLGVLTSAKLLKKSSVNGISETTQDDLKELIAPVSYGINIGFGYQFEDGLFFQSRFNIRISDIFDFEDALSQRNHVFQISAGYKF